jgi:hypothetical protein
MIRVEGLRKHFPGAASPALDGVSFTLETGQLAAIPPPDGARQLHARAAAGGVAPARRGRGSRPLAPDEATRRLLAREDG